jgi:hypothetical protein
MSTVNDIRSQASIMLMDYELSVHALVEQMHHCISEQLFREETVDEARHVLELVERGMKRTTQAAIQKLTVIA